MADQNTSPTPEGPGRASYAQPELKRLGTMAELTQAVATSKVNDGGKGSKKRSQ